MQYLYGFQEQFSKKLYFSTMYYNFMIAQFLSVDMYNNVTLYFVSIKPTDHKKIINNFKKHLTYFISFHEITQYPKIFYKNIILISDYRNFQQEVET